MKISMVSFLLFIGHLAMSQSTKELIKFNSSDGVTITADLYMLYEESAPFVIMFHQANWSRGEYNEIAPRFNTLQYNCMAVDLRSGGAVNNVTNQTKLNAVKAMKSTQYIDALIDIKAAIAYAKKHFAKGKIIILGSSYSAALSLVAASELNEEIDAVMAFSPGEYFTSQGESRDFVTSSATKIIIPTFITSAKSEKGSWWGMYISVNADNKIYFLPETVGNHGAKALWSKYPDSEDYWKATMAFLSSF